MKFDGTKICEEIITEVWEVRDLSNLEDRENNRTRLYLAAMNILLAHKDLIMNTHIVLIERQLAKNYKAVRISQHLISCLIMLMSTSVLNPLIYELDPKVKSRILAPGIKMDARQVKKWAIERAYRLLKSRGDENHKRLENKKVKKKDDLADTVIQIEAFCRLMNWDKSPDKIGAEYSLKGVDSHPSIKLSGDSKTIEINGQMYSLSQITDASTPTMIPPQIKGPLSGLNTDTKRGRLKINLLSKNGNG